MYPSLAGSGLVRTHQLCSRNTATGQIGSPSGPGRPSPESRRWNQCWSGARQVYQIFLYKFLSLNKPHMTTHPFVPEYFAIHLIVVSSMSFRWLVWDSLGVFQFQDVLANAPRSLELTRRWEGSSQDKHVTSDKCQSQAGWLQTHTGRLPACDSVRRGLGLSGTEPAPCPVFHFGARQDVFVSQCLSCSDGHRDTSEIPQDSWTSETLSSLKLS